MTDEDAAVRQLIDYANRKEPGKKRTSLEKLREARESIDCDKFLAAVASHATYMFRHLLMAPSSLLMDD